MSCKQANQFLIEAFKRNIKTLARIALRKQAKKKTRGAQITVTNEEIRADKTTPALTGFHLQ